MSMREHLHATCMPLKTLALATLAPEDLQKSSRQPSPLCEVEAQALSSSSPRPTAEALSSSGPRPGRRNGRIQQLSLVGFRRDSDLGESAIFPSLLPTRL